MRHAVRRAWPAGRLPRGHAHFGTSGFTLVELLAVIAIIGLLVGLLLPSLQRARESGRRSACANKMRQIGLACVQYEAHNGSFPSLVVGNGFCNDTTGTSPRPPSTSFLGRPGTLNTSGLVFILPFLEQLSVYSRVDLTKPMCPWNDPHLRSDWGVPPEPTYPANHQQVAMTRLDVFECPTATTVSRTDGLPTEYTDPVRHYFFGQCRGRLTNYQLVSNVAVPSFPSTRTPATKWNEGCDLWRAVQTGTNRAMFGEESFCKAAAIDDGLANVFMVAETCSNGNEIYHNPDAPPPGRGSTGQPWAYSDQVQWGINPAAGINMWGLRSGRAIPGYTKNPNTAASEHPGGCHVVFGDGSMRFVSENTNSSVLQRLLVIGDQNNPIEQLQ
jgi:prepilin-type N-terminal cleavage/methylation domain-containing protein